MKERRKVPATRKHLWLIGGPLVATLLVAALLGLALGRPSVAQGDPTTVSVVPAEKHVSPGEEFTIEIGVTDAEDLTAYEFQLDFDDEVLTFVGVEDDGLLGDVGDVLEETDTGIVFGAYKLDPSTGYTGDGTLAVVTFEAAKSGSSDLVLDYAKLEDVGAVEEMAATEDGLVIVAPELEIKPATMKVGVGKVFTQEVFINGAVDLVAYEFQLNFDQDLLDVVSIEDAGFLGAVEVVEEETATGIAFGATMTDPMEGVDGDGTLAIITFKAIAAGETPLDLSGSKLENSDAVEVEPVETDGFVEITTSTVYVDPEESWIYVEETGEVGIAVANAEDLVAYSFELSFDPAVVDAISVEDGGFLGDVVEVYTPTATGFIFAATSTDPMEGVDGDGTLAVVEFEGLVIGQSDLLLSNVVLLNSAAEEQFPATEDGMIDVICKPVSIVGDITSNSPLLLSETAQFTAKVDGTAPISYEWDFDGDGEVDDAGTVDDDTITGSFDYAEAGTYTAVLTVENCDGETDSAEVVVEVCECVQITDVETDSPVKVGEAMTFSVTATGTAPIGYQFDFGDGSTPEQTLSSSVTHVYEEAGTYTVIIGAANCPDAGPCTDVWPAFTVKVELYELFMPIIAKGFTP